MYFIKFSTNSESIDDYLDATYFSDALDSLVYFEILLVKKYTGWTVKPPFHYLRH